MNAKKLCRTIAAMAIFQNRLQTRRCVSAHGLGWLAKTPTGATIRPGSLKAAPITSGATYVPSDQFRSLSVDSRDSSNGGAT
jgi:hypothetical protein